MIQTKFSEQQIKEFELAREFFSTTSNDHSGEPHHSLMDVSQRHPVTHNFKAVQEMKTKTESDQQLKEKPAYEPSDDPERPRKKKKIGLRSEDFSVNLGKVIDTLNQDYPLIFVKPLDYSIYIDEIEVTDPTGIAF